uniref:CCHC-type domain-containing protein n=1 Tax=Tanacetum cinerariifolium TaxID=118510 RepID=A0A699IJK9_TANCI|nr:hypothetical protein [Tanacetum cinerariifolium]
MMLISHAITQRYSTPTNNRLHTSSNTRNQAVVQADRVNIQSRNAGNDGRVARRSSITQGESAESEYIQEIGNGNVQRILRTSLLRNASNVQCYNCNAKGHYARECPKLGVMEPSGSDTSEAQNKDKEDAIVKLSINTMSKLMNASLIMLMSKKEKGD